MSEYISQILIIVGVLTAVTNIVVEVLKQFTRDKVNTNIIAVIVSEFLTLCAFFAYCSIKVIAIEWYAVIGAIIVGIFVSYAAMFGFDKLKQALEQAGQGKE